MIAHNPQLAVRVSCLCRGIRLIPHFSCATSRPISSVTYRNIGKEMAKDASSLPVPLTAEPATGQLVEHEGKIYTTVKEGKAYILVPPNARTSVDPQAKSKAGEHIS